MICSSQAIINLGAQHDLLEKLLFKLKVGAGNQQDISLCIHNMGQNQEQTHCLCRRLTLFLCYAQVLPYELPHQEQEVAKQLTKAGHLVTEPSQADLGALVVTFVSKLHVDYTRFCFYRASSSTVAQMPTSMSDFLRLVLQRMGFVQMANPLNNSKRPSSRLSLAQFHNDFYR